MLRCHHFQHFDQSRPATRQSSFCLSEILHRLEYVMIEKSEADSCESVSQKQVIGFGLRWRSRLYFWSFCYCTSQYSLTLFCLRCRIWIYQEVGPVLAKLHFLWRPDLCDVNFQCLRATISHWNLASIYCWGLARSSGNISACSDYQSCLPRAASASTCKMIPAPLWSCWRSSYAYFGFGFWSHRCILAARW